MLTLTVIIEDVGEAANVGGSVHRRTVRLTLTEEQSRSLTLRDSWERLADCIVEEASDE